MNVGKPLIVQPTGYRLLEHEETQTAILQFMFRPMQAGDTQVEVVSNGFVLTPGVLRELSKRLADTADRLDPPGGTTPGRHH